MQKRRANRIKVSQYSRKEHVPSEETKTYFLKEENHIYLAYDFFKESLN